MRTLLAVSIAFLPLLHAQDSQVVKAVEPRYDLYSPDLVKDFDVATAPVVVTVGADGKPLTFATSTVPLPMAVVMALKDYEFRREGSTPHSEFSTSWSKYEVKLNVPIRQPKPPHSRAAMLAATTGAQPTVALLGPGIVMGLREKFVQPVYPDASREAGVQGKVILEAVLTKEGEVGPLTTAGGPFALVEAAYDAVKQWQFKPYLLRHEPAEVLTEITVNFNSK